MPISDMNPNTKPADTDAICAGKLQRNLKQAIRAARRAVSRAGVLVSNAPGGKDAVNSELGVTQSEASAILDKLAVLVNSHKATGSSDVSNPLL